MRGPRKYCNKFLSFHALQFYLNYEMYCIVIGCFGEGGFSPKNILEILVSSPRNFSVFTTKF